MREKFTATDRPKETRKPGPLLAKPTLTRVKVQPEASVIATKTHTLEPLQPQDTVYRSPSKWLTVFLVITLCTCICWTLWLLMFNIAPNTMTNRIMRTEHLDEGSFWRFVDLNRTQLWLALIGLVTVVTGSGYSTVPFRYPPMSTQSFIRAR
ncbi:Hypothetical protein PHPALM_14623 [Phytophthora palmivora]|uniref:Uncharacterized protein n=1 Tax=Phytophthora palmivora TaxID=4796 RepID=A0A2P4XUC5_9STRA|nr:Hypothetical protein PHPALM_14623 [Phytophthora palmivora]